MQIAYQAKQSKVHKELKATKVPEISQAQLVYKSKLNQNETDINQLIRSKWMCKAQGLRHVSQATYKTNKLDNDF